MFPALRDGEEYSPAAEVSRMLYVAGCDITDEHHLQMGMISYNVALLASRQRRRNKSIARPAQKSRAGRNDPCPCGSGRKYKKCCLDKNRALSTDDPVASWTLEPAILPRLWDQKAVSEDCEILTRIMDRDPAFAGVGFSKDKVACFVEAIVEEDPSLMRRDDDEEPLNRAIDDLALRYIRESGEGRIIRGMRDKFLAAVARAQSKDEVRALATGICFELMGEVSSDPDDSLLGIIFFRKALFGALRQTALIDKVMDQLGGDAQELRRMMATNDPSIHQKIDSVMKGLTSSDIETLETTYEQSRNDLWNTISADEFPVPLPFATQFALVGRLAQAKGENCSPEELYEIVETFSDELIEEDYIVYGQMLDRWLRNRKGRPDHVAKAVQLMAGMCAARSIRDLAINVLVRGGRRGLVVAFDEEERRFIDNCPDPCDDLGFVAEYGAWLASKGYPEMANRLRKSWEDYASGTSRDLVRRRSSAA